MVHCKKRTLFRRGPLSLKQFTLTWRITEKASNVLLRDFLKDNKVSKAALTDIKFRGGNILVNGYPVTVRYVLQVDDVLVIQFPLEKPSNELMPENIPLQIVYEDDYILVVNKPAFMSTIPSREHRAGSLAHAILHYYNQIGLLSTIHVVNRLDRDTSGLLIVAKHRHVHHLFSELQKSADIKRRYEAVVHGLLEYNVGTIDAPIGRKQDSIIEREVRSDGQHAITHYTVLDYLSDKTHVSLQLGTGRTHQIRVHLSYLGHPLLGDTLYGGKRERINRQALHCCEVCFFHPILEKELSFTVSLPEDIKTLLGET